MIERIGTIINGYIRILMPSNIIQNERYDSEAQKKCSVLMTKIIKYYKYVRHFCLVLDYGY